MSRALRRRWSVLETQLRSCRRVLIAFSGGCDSTLLVAAARRVLGKENVLAVTAVSASLAEREREAVESLAGFLDVEHLALATEELSRPAYQSNPPNRCFFCKDELFSKLSPVAAGRAMRIADGFNFSDRADFRPGYEAAARWGVLHPLEEAGLSKDDVRALSRWLRLPTWNKPSSPCLSSRIPYGTPVTLEALRRIDQAEALVRLEGFRVVRVRHYGPLARVEVPAAELDRLLEAARWARIVRGLRNIGYQEVAADPRGFQSGRLNEKWGAASVG